MVARFLNFYPGYSLADLRNGGLTLADFSYLYGGMLDVLNPDATRPFSERVAEAVKAQHMKASGG